MSPVPTRRQPHALPSSPPRAPVGPPSPPIELAYNAAVQAFVRRDHARLFAALARVFALLPALERARAGWADPDRADWTDGDEWAVKALKLYISACAMAYAEPPKPGRTGGAPAAAAAAAQLEPALAAAFPPASPVALLEHVHAQCIRIYFGAGGRSGPAPVSPGSAADGLGDPAPSLLPPSLMSTLLLAALKLPAPALDFAHGLAERWLVDLPDAFVAAVSRAGAGAGGGAALPPERRRRLESAREGYLKVVELFVGEVLCREEEWGMAKGFLEGEVVMGIKRKEALYKHVRARQHARERPGSPASSGILPLASSATLAPAGKPRPRAPSASSSSSAASAASAASSSSSAASPAASSSSSERTARPPSFAAAVAAPLTPTARAHRQTPAAAPAAPDAEPRAARPAIAAGPLHAARAQLARLAGPLRHSLPDWLAAAARAPWVTQLALPLPLLLVLALLARRRARTGAGLTGAVGGAAGVGLRERLRRARRESLAEWARWWLRWWWAKLVGVWQLGTTITYV